MRRKTLLVITLCLLPCAAFAATAIMNSFNAGEITPRLGGRTDVRKYYSGCQLLENMHVRLQGPVSKRPGTYYIATTAGSETVRVIGFEHSTGQGRVLEFSNETIRFFK